MTPPPIITIWVSKNAKFDTDFESIKKFGEKVSGKIFMA